MNEEPIVEKFSGSFDRIQVIDLVQIACYCVMNADVAVDNSAEGGLVCIRAGQVVDCRSGARSGEEAIREIFSLRAGSFLFKPEAGEVEQSIKKGWEQLLVEAIRYRMDANARPPGHEAGFAGRIEKIDLVDLMQLACLSKVDRLLKIATDADSGMVLFNETGIVHAAFGELEGESAFQEIMLSDAGSFESSAPQGDEPATIDSSWENLLIEAQRRRDEMNSTDEASRVQSLAHKLQKMRVSDKIRLALVGNKETRTLLVRDSNKMIQLAVLSNPKLTESEVTLIAASKYTDEEVLRRISQSREWMRLRQVRMILVSNPKVPVGVANKLVETLGPFEWKRIAASKSVPALVAATARRLLTKNN